MAIYNPIIKDNESKDTLIVNPYNKKSMTRVKRKRFDRSNKCKCKQALQKSSCRFKQDKVFSEVSKSQIQAMSCKKSVRFSKMTSVVSIPAISAEEVRMRWHSLDDYNLFGKNRCSEVVHIKRALITSKSLDPDQHTMIGLENRISLQQLYKRRFNLLRHTQFVLRQQAYQRSMGVHDPELLRFACEISSRNSNKL